MRAQEKIYALLFDLLDVGAEVVDMPLGKWEIGLVRGEEAHDVLVQAGLAYERIARIYGQARNVNLETCGALGAGAGEE